MTDFLKSLTAFFHKPRNLFIVGICFTAAFSLFEIVQWNQNNFFTFQFAAFDFWHGVSPYGHEYDYLYDYLYGPLFNILFAPFAYMGPVAGPLVWNLFNFTIFFYAIFSLPDRYTEKQKCRTFLYTALILATTQLSFQINPFVAAVFMLGFSLMERGRPFLAILLIMASGFMKIYGIFELGILLFYPRFWRNMLYVLVIGAVFFFLPLVRLPWDSFMPFYERWIEILGLHVDQYRFYSMFNLYPVHDFLTPIMPQVQAGVIAVLGILLLLNYKKFANFAFRAGAVGILMGYVILFSLSTEKHTYVIALIGFLLWYWIQ